MRKIKLYRYVILLILSSNGVAAGDEPDNFLENSWNFAGTRLKNMVEALPSITQYPRTVDSNGNIKTVSASDWTSGFFPGCLWLTYKKTKVPYFKIQAERFQSGLESQKYNTGTHDVGFMIFNSYGNGFQLTGNPEFKEVCLTAAQSLAKRFNSAVGCIESWSWGDSTQGWDFPVIIDNVMNLELLFWASKNGGTDRLYKIAVWHADQTIKEHIREDYSTFHVVNYHHQTGKVIDKRTHQGYADSSTWARGQAWAIYGFTMTFRETHQPRFLKTAQSLADYFIDNLPQDHIPFWDFNAPNIPAAPKDASAAAIAASALLELSVLSEDANNDQRYWNTASAMLKSLASEKYSAKQKYDYFLIDHCTGNKPANSEIDLPLIYADYYFLEALLRYEQYRSNHTKRTE